MKYFFAIIPLACLISALANSTVKPTKATRCNVNNNYNSFYAGPNCKKIEQQLAEIRQEIRALKSQITARKNSQKLITASNDHFISVYKNCAEVYKSGDKISGVYKINPDGLSEFEVFCDQKTAGGGWTVFQRRRDGSVDFFRAWDDYKRGFGNLNGEFWLGLDKIHRLTVSSGYKLRIDLGDIHGKTAFAEYSSFSVKSEKAKYQLNFGSYSGTAGDGLGRMHRGMSFSTKDRDNDRWGRNCALHFKGAWWYNDCHHSNLNGLYLNGKSDCQGMRWNSWPKGPCYSVKKAEMKIRPKDF
ncbi:unnamed protein product [Porites lobata]|uniref:Fibrinogen C-terminal domain-containing protein n=1 Tax=Porites lobata TaxID=104759 RepID=A0ABN8N1E8_9CNID|nr:unnamed protein product [Porites lobata]